MTALKNLFARQYVWALVALIVLLLIDVIKDPGYLAISSNSSGDLSGNLIDILRQTAPILMIAVGMTLVIATEGIDLSVGSVMAVAGAVTMQFLSSADNTVGAAFTALGLALLVSLALGLVNGILVAWVGLQPFITTLIMMLSGRGIARVITGGQNTAAENDLVNWIANGRVIGFPVVTIIAAVIVVIVALLVRRTALGMMIESLGINSKASRLLGIRPKPLLLTVYALSALLAGIGGIFSTASVMTVEVSRTGLDLEMDAILAVVVGGTSLAGGKFSIAGSVIGALLITTLNKTVVFLSIPSTATPAFKAIVIVVVCLLQSQRVRSWLKRKRRPSPTPPTLPSTDGEVVTDDAEQKTLEPATVESPTGSGRHAADDGDATEQTKGEQA
ncbi:MAG: ABC transporter permease [Galactobacter sp.]